MHVHGDTKSRTGQESRRIYMKSNTKVYILTMPEEVRTTEITLMEEYDQGLVTCG